MKKSSHSSPSPKKTSYLPKALDPVDDVPGAEISVDEENLAADQFAVSSRGDEASSSGHRIEPIEPDEEGNAETLIEEGLHGYLHVSSKKSRKAR